MAERKNTAAKTIVTLIAVLLVACTFAARPVQTMNTAVVTAMTAKQRRLEYDQTVEAGKWYTGSTAAMSIPYSIAGGLKIDSIYVSDLDTVDKGTPLLAFDRMSGEMALREAENELLSAQIAYKNHLEQAEDQYWRTEKEIRQLQENMRYQKKAERPYTEAEIERLKNELAVLETGESDEKTLLERQLDAAQGKYDALKALSDDDWILRSEEKGFVQDIAVSTGGVYSGVEAIMTVCREDDMLYLLVPIERKWMLIEQEYGAAVTVHKGEDAVSAQWVGTENREDGLYARLEIPWAEGERLIGQCRAVFDAVSTKNAYIVPKKAISDGSVFVMGQKPGYFGYDYYARLVSVKTGDESGDMIEVTGGIGAGDIVIIDSDREIRDGDRVMYEIK